MTEPDLLLNKLAELPLAAPSAEFSEKLTDAAHARLVPLKVHPAWGVAIAASVLVYLSWAAAYTSQLF